MVKIRIRIRIRINKMRNIRIKVRRVKMLMSLKADMNVTFPPPVSLLTAKEDKRR